MSTMAILNTITTAASAGSAAVKAYTEYENEKAQAAVSGYNEAVARDDAARTYAEYAMNAGLARANARRQIATAENSMVASGNIGTSADAAVYDAYLNLSSDLAAMKYQYDNTAIKYLNEAENHAYNKAVANKNKKNAVWGGVLNTTAAVGQGLFSYYLSGGLGSAAKYTKAIKAQQAIPGAAVDYGQAMSAAGMFS